MRAIAWLVGVAVFGIANVASASEISGFTEGQWIGAAHASGAGAFTYCEAGTLFKNGTSLVITEDRAATWSMSLTDERWHLPTGHQYPLQVRFDEGPWLSLDSSAVSSSLLHISLPNDGTLLAMVRAGHSIQITSGSFDKRYDLVGSARAMDRLEGCVGDQLHQEAVARDTAKATAQTYSLLATAGIVIYLAPMAPIIVVAVLASPDYHPTLADPEIVANIPAVRAEEPNLGTAANVAGGVPTMAPKDRTEVTLREEDGTYLVPVQINGVVTLEFTVDSGASAVVIPADVFRTLVRAKTITDADLLGTSSVTFADGSTATQQAFRIRSLQVGDTTLENVIGSVAPEQGSLLLGQTFLSRFSAWSMNNKRHVLVLDEATLPN